MKHKLRAWLLILALFLACGVSVGVVVWLRTRPLTPVAMAARMPAGAVTLFVDFDALKRGNLMDRIFGSKIPQDPDYLGFVDKTGFDFRNHLSSLMIAFAPKGNYMLLNGKFDWKKLREYTEKQGGKCYLLNCSVAGSVAERRISFLPLRTNVMALAVTPQDNAARRLVDSNSDIDDDVEVPNAPVWLSIPNGALMRPGVTLPAGAQIFARALDHAETVIFTLALENGQLTANMQVQCLTEFDARTVADNLIKLTTYVQKIIEREGKTPSPRDLSGLLTAGTFRASGTQANGRWTIPDEFVSSMLDGEIQ